MIPASKDATLGKRNLLLWAFASLFVVGNGICCAQVVPSSNRPELIVQTGHSWEVRSLAFSADGKTLASGSLDGTVKLWDVSTGAELRTLKGCLVAFSTDGKTLAVADVGTVKLWDVSTGAELRTIEAGPVSSFVFSPDGKTLASGRADGTVKLWDVSSGSELRALSVHPKHTLSGYPNFVLSLAFSSDGQLLASGSTDGTVNVSEVSTGAELRTLKGQWAITAIVLSTDRKILASDMVSGDITARLWDLSTGAELRALKIDKDVKSVAFSLDGKFFAGGTDRTVKVWDVSTSRELAALKGESNYVESVVFSADGKTLATGSPDGTIKLCDVSTGLELRTLKGHSDWIESVAFSPDGKILASGSVLGTEKLWDISTGSPLRTLKEHSRDFSLVVFSPDGKIIASSGFFQGTVKLWDVSTGAELRTLKGQFADIKSVAFSPNGKILASASYEKNIKLWDVSTGTELRTLKDQSGTKWSVAFSPDGKILASGSLGGAVKLWEASTGAELPAPKGHSKDVSSVAFSPNGKILASASYDKTAKLWEVSTGVELHTLKGHASGVLSVAFSPDGKILATASQDNTVKLWDTSTGAEMHTLTGHFAEVNSVAFSPNGRYLASGSRDSTLRIWDVSSGKELAVLIALDQDDWLVVTTDGLFDGSPGAWNKILWRFSVNLNDVAPVEIFFNEFYYPGLLADLLVGKHPIVPSDFSQKDRRQPWLKLELGDGEADNGLATRNVTVKIGVSQAPAGAQDLRLFRNGSLVKLWRGDVLKGRTSIALRATIPIVAGENRLTAYAFNHDNIKSGDATMTINGGNNLKRSGVAYVIGVGINRYANSEYNLRNAVADARDFAEELKRQQTKLNKYERVEVISLKDSQATKANILNSLSNVRTRIQPEDLLVIFFAGHGTAHDDQFHLIPHDLGYARSRDEWNGSSLQTILSHSISDRELERAVEKIDAGQLLLVIDACNSGQALEAKEKRRGPMNSKGLAQLAYEKGMYILTAAQSYQAALEADRLGHGYLTYALVEEGLKTNAADRAPRDGQVLLREWLNYATERVPQMQQLKIEEQLRRGQPIERVIKFSDADTGTQRNVQRPRVFYRREIEPTPLVMAKPGQSASKN
jgi:WD40 repeat protein/uncharacterized caspase-like protein